MFLSHDAAYCLKAGKSLKPFFPILLHDTCVRHAMLLSLEHVRLNTDVAKDCFATWVRSGIFFLPRTGRTFMNGFKT